MIRIRSALTAQQHALAMVGVIIALGIAVAVAHGAAGQDHMGGLGGMEDSHVGQSAVVSMCLAVLEAGAAGAVLLGGSLLVRRRPADTPRDLGAPFLSTATERKLPVPRARAGPSLLQVYRL